MKKIGVGLLILLVIVVIAFIAFSNWYNNAIYSPASNLDDNIEFNVFEGDTLISIIPKLKGNGLVSSEEALRIYLRLNNVSANIKVGTYLISKNINIPELIEILEQGTFKSYISVTIREGLRYEQIAPILEEKFEKVGEDTKFEVALFLKIAEKPDNYNFTTEVEEFLNEIKPVGNPLRGLLFPDTYRFSYDATTEDVVGIMVLNLKTRLEENNIKLNNNSIKSIYEGLILASIVEKEASFSDDSSLIAGVFYNRLKQNFPLQADSTVNFITGKNDAGVLIEDTKIDSPYNTYKYVGLPPTPINNPGIKSIKGAFNPKATDFFYFIHDSNGQSYFAVTFEEHQRNIQNHL